MLALETQRLLLRSWREDDVAACMTLAHDVGYNCFSTPGRFLVHSIAEAKKKIRERMDLFDEQRLGKFPVFLKPTGEFIGTCGMEPFVLDGRKEVELGYRLCLKYWGHGYAAEAAAAILRYGFVDFGCEKITAFALPQNRASLKILEKLGFEYRREFLHAELPHRLYEFPRGRFSG
jgi:ribosomal-protein-alanine N-acetyltransferase